MRRLLALTLVVACVPEPPRGEFGVDVFSNDTTPAKFIVSLGGNLSFAVRSNVLYLQRDTSLVIETPASLILQSGAGTGTITSYDTTAPRGHTDEFFARFHGGGRGREDHKSDASWRGEARDAGAGKALNRRSFTAFRMTTSLADQRGRES